MSSLPCFARKTTVWLVVGLLLASCAPPSSPDAESKPEQPEPTPEPLSSDLIPDLGPAPDITNDVWLNSDQPLDLAALRGKVVLVEFWTFG